MTASPATTIVQRRFGPQRVAERALGVLDKVLGAVAAAILATLLVVVLVNVTLRYLFHTGFIGAEDLGIWLNVAMIAVGAPLSPEERFGHAAGFIRALPAGTLSCGNRSSGRCLFLCRSPHPCFRRGGDCAMLRRHVANARLPEWVRFGFLGAGGALIFVYLALQRVGEGKALAVLLSVAIAVVSYVGLPELFCPIRAFRRVRFLR